MSQSELLRLAESGDLAAFESRCVELLGSGARLAELVAPFELLGAKVRDERVATLGQTIIEGAAEADSDALLCVTRVSLLASPQDQTLRTQTIELYRQTHGEKPGFDRLLDVSGLTGDRPARNAVRLLELCLTLKKGDTLLSRTEEQAVEVMDVDLASGLFTVRRGAGRPSVLPAIDLSREFERVERDDFRVLKQLYPDRLRDMLDSDPVTVVIDILKSHGGGMDQDSLKYELTPRFLAPDEWAKWWTKARAKLKKSQYITLSGRAPVYIEYSAQARTLEDEVWERLEGQKEPEQWLATIESYLRDKRALSEEPAQEFIDRVHGRIVDHIKNIRKYRPSEALASALVVERMDRQAGISDDAAKTLAIDMLKESDDAAKLLAGLPDNNLWELGFEALEVANPEAAPGVGLTLMPLAPANVLDQLYASVYAGGRAAEAAAIARTAMDAPVDYPEIMYWLWKGPKQTDGLDLPADADLFAIILDTLDALGRTLIPAASKMRTFRTRIRAALGLRDFSRATDCLKGIEADRAVTVRQQLLRLDGIGDTARDRLAEALREAHPRLWVKKQVQLAPWEDDNIILCTTAGLRRRQDERDDLVNVKMRENAQRIGEAAALGDLSENSEYKFALEERDLLRGRLATLNNELSIAQTIQPDDVPSDYVGVGSRVRIRGLTGDERVILFVGPFEADADRDVFNYRAPLGQKFMGTKVGTTLLANLGNGEQEYEILAVENGLADSPVRQ
ncbi:MAG: GreA/GreB family elongation factor [Phycisphaerales bacterium]|nr:GreA/GreB family elongation factor [Phycisphaerales bacterium]